MKTEDKKPAKKAVPGKIFDVSRPGKAPASPTSRPVIMGHKPEAQAAQTSVSGIGEASPLLTKRNIQVLPSGGAPEEQATATDVAPEDLPAGMPTPAPAEAEEAALGTAAVDAVSGPPALPPEREPESEPEEAVPEKPNLVIAPPPDTETKEQEAEIPGPQTPEPEAPAEKPADPETTVPPAEEAKPETAPATEDIPSGTSSSVPESETEPTEPAADPLKPEAPPPYPKIDPLFDEDGHIVVSHHNHHGSHGVKVVLLLLLILLLAAAGLDLALDLELLTVEGLPHTDLF